MADPLQLSECNALCGSNDDLSKNIRDMADDIDNGTWNTLSTVIVLLEDTDGMLCRVVFGRPTDTTRVAGLLFTEATRIANG